PQPQEIAAAETTVDHHPRASRIARRTTPRVSGILYAFFERARAPVTDASLAFAASSSVMRWPVSIRSTSGSRHGIGATPPSTMRADRQRSEEHTSELKSPSDS